ncbi:hypothetical protein [Bacillus sp. V2I10]|uniref:hypothetical protein n=1 Tax=Bacillus sp. V2I10 TaxID=3042276 RepID=UPI00278904C9|nr:hypothetical protein [Bacillus sp. V2I10]MDQ0858763.1 hypothetical protein [Bacillus sp. V2I10]
MLWIILFSPLLLLSALAIYFDKVSGMSLPEHSKQDEHSGFLSGNANAMNSNGGDGNSFSI